MCQFGDEFKIISESVIPEEAALIGWRNNLVPIKGELYLQSPNQKYIWPIDGAVGTGLERGNSLGVYNYNYYYKNHYYNYYYKNSNYNYYYKNYNYYNIDNYNYNYYIQVKSLHYGRVFTYQDGYRSEFCRPTHIIILDKNSEWFTDNQTKEFANHFNSRLEELARMYNCETLEWSKSV